MRPTTRTVPSYRAPAPAPKKRGKRRVLLAVAIVVIAALAFHFGAPSTVADKLHLASSTDTNANAIRSGYSNTCLDVYHSETISGAPVDAATCNGTAAQKWKTTDTTIREADTKSCVTAGAHNYIVMDSCSNTNPAQVWLRDQQGYFNPNTTECLSAGTDGSPLKLGSCNNMSWVGVTWMPNSAAQAPACGGSEGQMISCEAIKEWTAWQQPNANHENLLTTYTDGTPYEEWCADFVSYVYKEAGYPFTSGSANGWDENDANSVQYMGFTIHQAGNGYVPQPGDVAFFDYPGGHVEIVVSGGNKPTFVYGDSAQIDPTTGNGQMKANTILQNDIEQGQIQYYMTPAGI